MQAAWVRLFWSELPVVVVWRVWGVGEASVPYGPEKRESGTRERKPQVEQYGLDDPAASAEAVLAGLGPLAAGLAGLAVEASRSVTLDAMEVLVTGRGRELLRGLVELALDTQAEGEVRLPGVTGEDGVEWARAEPGHGRPVVTLLGEVRVRRIGYRSGVRGVLSLFPRDAVLWVSPPSVERSS